MLSVISEVPPSVDEDHQIPCNVPLDNSVYTESIVSTDSFIALEEIKDMHSTEVPQMPAVSGFRFRSM